MTKWLTVDEVAQYLRTTTSTIYKLNQRGRIHGYKAGRTLIFDADEVDSDIRARLKKKGQSKVRTNADKRKVS